MTLPRTFRKSRDNILASFSFTDLASGTGFVTYNGFNSEDSNGLDFHLTEKSTGFSQVVGQTIDLSGSGTAFDLDFDTSTFNLPRTIEGEAIVTLGCGLESLVTTGGRATITVKIRKWDGSTETEIVSVTSATDILTVTAGNNEQELLVIPLTVPRTLIKKGELLRLTIIIEYTKVGGSGDGRVILGHDPKDRDFDKLTPSSNKNHTTSIIFEAPFRINI